MISLQKPIYDFPPNYDALLKAFPAIKGKNVLFSYGNKLYNPGSIMVPEFLIVHEQTHGTRQVKDVEGWWEQYIADPEFRLEEELMAHYMEQRFRLGLALNRRERRAILKQTAERLASPIYGPVVGKKKALELLRRIG